MNNDRYRFSVSPATARRIEETALALEFLIFCGCFVSLVVLLAHQVMRGLGVV